MSISRPARIAPLCVNHVGITVPDIFAAIDWYCEVFGMTHLMGSRLITADGSSTSETRKIFGGAFRRMLQAHVVSGNGVGFELFEPLDPKPEATDKGIQYLRGGPWHIALMHPDVDAMIDMIVSAGGRLHTAPITFVPGRPWRLAYTRDPWWTTIEIVSHSYAEMFANWPQPGTQYPTETIDRASAARLRADS